MTYRKTTLWTIRPALLAFLSAGVLLLLFGSVTQASAKGRTAATKPTVVLVHGAWADGSSWAGVAKDLQARGYTVDVPPNPLRGLHSDSEYLKDYLSTINGPIVLAGHSYGGAVITDAATGDSQVRALVYVDAFIPAEGQSILQILTPPKGSSQPPLNPPALFNFVPFPGAPKGVTDWYLKPAVFMQVLANGVPKTQAEVLAATQRPIASNALTEASTAPAWQTIPSWDVIGTEDQILPPALQEAMAKTAGSHITDIKAGHLSGLIEHPAAIAHVISTAATHS
ncbi:MAG: alpha/beta hydrolase [Solirubrobacteraceae bacterium]